jgi:hypothetical protein
MVDKKLTSLFFMFQLVKLTSMVPYAQHNQHSQHSIASIVYKASSIMDFLCNVTRNKYFYIYLFTVFIDKKFCRSKRAKMTVCKSTFFILFILLFAIKYTFAPSLKVNFDLNTQPLPYYEKIFRFIILAFADNCYLYNL